MFSLWDVGARVTSGARAGARQSLNVSRANEPPVTTLFAAQLPYEHQPVCLLVGNAEILGGVREPDCTVSF
jgi:hypothetical protein